MLSSSNSPITLQVFLPWLAGSRGDPVCVSSFGDSGLPSDLTSLMDLQRVVDFSVGSAFYLLLGENGYYQAPSMPNWAMEFLFCPFLNWVVYFLVVEV